MWRLCGGRGPWVQIVGSMPNLGYQCIFSCSINLEGSPLDPSNGMLQIAAYLQHICSTFVAHGNFSKIMNAVKMKLRIWYLWSLIILPTKFHDAAATRSAAAICCSNQKCCSNVLQNCECSKDGTQDLVSLEYNHISYQIS